jgi:hypothetical protein
VNGAGAIDPQAYDRLRKQVETFPDKASVAALRELGVRSLLLHSYGLAGTSWEHAAERPIDGLGIEREDVDGVVVFRLR